MLVKFWFAHFDRLRLSPAQNNRDLGATQKFGLIKVKKSKLGEI